MAAILIAGCGVAQAVVERRDAPAREEQYLLRNVAVLERNYQVLARAQSLARQRADGVFIMKLLDSLSDGSIVDPLPLDELRGLRDRAGAAAGRPLSDADAREFQERLAGLAEQARRAYASERKKLWQFRDEVRFRRLR